MNPPAASVETIDLRGIESVVIGASVGGIEALGLLLAALPPSTRAAVLIVQHLPRERPSLLVDIFQPGCALAVREAEDKEPVEPGTVYFAPPDYHLLVDRGHLLADRGHLLAGRGHPREEQAPILLLSVDDPVLFARPAIDVLFEAAADLYGPRLLGIVLTGANADGAAGLKAVQGAGGIAIVQDPDTAQAALMPLSALQQTPTAHVLTLAQMCELLARLP